MLHLVVADATRGLHVLLEIENGDEFPADDAWRLGLALHALLHAVVGREHHLRVSQVVGQAAVAKLSPEKVLKK